MEKAYPIIFNEKLKLVQPLLERGSVCIVLDEHGAPLMRWWKQDGPEGQRKSQWRYFEHGIVSLQRAVIHALASGKDRILTLEEVNDLREKVRGEFIVAEKLDDLMRTSAADEINQMLRTFSRTRTTELREARGQLRYLLMFTDSKGRFNVGMLLCRDTAVERRIRKRLDSIAIWSQEYAHRLAILNGIIDRFYRAVHRFEIALTQDMRISEKQSITPKELEHLQDRARTYRAYFLQFIDMHPFRNWVLHTYEDLAHIEVRVRHGFPYRIAEVHKKLLEAVQIKKVHQQVDELILELSHFREDVFIDPYRERLQEIARTLQPLTFDGFHNRTALEITRTSVKELALGVWLSREDLKHISIAL